MFNIQKMIGLIGIKLITCNGEITVSVLKVKKNIHDIEY